MHAEDNTSGLLNRGGIADLPLLRTLLAIRQESTRAKFLGNNELFCFISIFKFGSFKNPFATITSLSELYLRIRRFFSLVQGRVVWCLATCARKPKVPGLSPAASYVQR